MKSAGQYAKTATKYQQTSTETSTKTQLPESLVIRLWEKLRIRYRDQWTKRVGTNPAEVKAQMLDWQEVLGGLSPEQIKNGWDKWDSEFPPNSLQFRTACKTEITKELHKEYKVLPRPPRNPLVASAALRAMRAAL